MLILVVNIVQFWREKKINKICKYRTLRLPHLKIDKKSMKSWPVNMQIQYIPICRRNFFIYVSKKTNMEILILFTKIVVQGDR